MNIKQLFCRHKWEHVGFSTNHDWSMYKRFRCKKCRKYKHVKLIECNYKRMNFKIKM